MSKKYLIIIIGVVIVLGVIGLIRLPKKGPASIVSAVSAENVIEEVKKEVGCDCGCGLSLENCEKYDPACPVRPTIIAEIVDLAEQGKSKEEIINIFSGAESGSISGSIISEDDDPAKGSTAAPVTIIEFSDYQCPFCARFYSETLKKIEEEYIDTGKVRFVYRDFPLSFHSYAQKSAEAAECADEQGKFWEYHNLLFENQAEWSSQGISKLKEYAGRLGLNQDRFDACLDNGDMAAEVQKDFSDGQKYGVTGTPAFFVNGELVSGALPFESFKQVIEKFLK